MKVVQLKVKNLYAQLLLMLTFAAMPALAFDKPKLNENGGGDQWYSGLTALLQSVIDFIMGPYAMFIGLIGLVIAVVGWIMGEKASGAIATGLRVVSGIAALFAVVGILAGLAQ